uniref:TadE/TadG family type IV pilus assembly protein n=1 Tax=Altererythrobacter segetis TaxID=1104773 RepID=UPI0014084942|nr:TadE/TadG family type IV pilus assembly protein [Altererythrobacter segetis]
MRRRLLSRLASSRTGVAATEFALCLPFLLGAGLMGLEVANRAIIQTQVAQLAAQIADNASRIGDTSTLQDRKIYENDIDDLLRGAAVQGGGRLDLFGHGRVIISSLEVVPGSDDRQYIHWQRCAGTKHHLSSYGLEGDGLNGELAGMGPAGKEVWAFPDEAVIFVEVAYDYRSLVGPHFGMGGEIVSTASFTVRDDRDLTQIYQRNPAAPDPVASCSTYTDPTVET